MPKVAIFFSIILLSSVFSSSYGFMGDMTKPVSNDSTIFDSGIIDLDLDFFSSHDKKRYLIFGDSPTNLQNSLYDVQSNNGFFSVAVLDEDTASRLSSQGYGVIEDFELDFHQTDDASRIGQITGSTLAQNNYNATGKGIKIAIVDTGVDFSNLDIRDSLARDKKNHPIMLDPDGQGIVLTNATFYGFIDKNEIIRNYTKPLPEGVTSSAYVTRDGVFLNLSQNGKGTNIPIHNSFFPQIGVAATFNGTISNDMKIGNDNRNFIKSKSGMYHLGVIYQGGLSGNLARVQVVPVLFVDSYIAGQYDTIIPDLTTSWEDYTRFDLQQGQQPDYDFDFTDEKPIVLGSGKEFLVYDSDGDGKDDYSAGTIGARVLDIHSIVQNKTSDKINKVNAINGTLLPAIDPKGNFFGIMSDFVGHGTSSTASITSKGVETYDIYNDTRKFTITGVAPDAKIIPVKALWFGDTVYAWLWSAGFENNEDSWACYTDDGPLAAGATPASRKASRP